MRHAFQIAVFCTQIRSQLVFNMQIGIYRDFSDRACSISQRLASVFQIVIASVAKSRFFKANIGFVLGHPFHS